MVIWLMWNISLALWCGCVFCDFILMQLVTVWCWFEVWTWLGFKWGCCFEFGLDCYLLYVCLIVWLIVIMVMMAFEVVLFGWFVLLTLFGLCFEFWFSLILLIVCLTWILDYCWFSVGLCLLTGWLWLSLVDFGYLLFCYVV